MIEIDGSEGEGGGQMVRSSLALAAVTGQPVRLTNIRGGREKPGLLRQHLAGVRAIKAVCSGDVDGDQLGSAHLTLTPGKLSGGGRIVMKVEPSSGMCGIQLTDRVGKLHPNVTALVSRIPESVGERERDVIARKTGWDRKAFQVVSVQQAGGPGNVVMIELAFDNVCELIIGFGKIGVKAEQVARATLREAQAHLASDVPVGVYLFG